MNVFFYHLLYLPIIIYNIILFMLEFLLLGTFITSVWVTYILYYKPIREIRLLKEKCEGLGYKVEVLPYSLIGSSKRVRHK